jgi:Fic family protein
VDRNILPTPLLYISAFFEATRRDYYDHLIGVTEKGEWDAWLEYFLNGVARQSEDALDRARRINAHFSRWRRETAGMSSRSPSILLDYLLANPFITTKGVAAKLRVAFTTAQRAIEKLEKRSILKEVSGGKRDRVYCAKAILDILEEPAAIGRGQ